jgi:D-sedoheptulose 7-phosphate isomerase
VGYIDAAGAADTVRSALSGHQDTVRAVAALEGAIIAAAEAIAAAFAGGHQLLLCGNGGSAADAQHIAAEFTGRYLTERTPLPALALTTNTSGLTAIGNDYGFDEVFARQVRAHGRSGDVLLAISTSGSSANVVSAMGAAREHGMKVVGLSGPGGSMAGACDVCLSVPGDSTPRIQEGHILIGHIICGLVEDALEDAGATP